MDRETLVTKARPRRSGGRAAKADVLTRGGLALRLKGRRGSQDLWSEKSAEAVVAAQAAKGRTMGRRDAHAPRGIMPQKPDEDPGGRSTDAVKPQERTVRVEAPLAGRGDERPGSSDLMEKVCERQNLQTALKRVRQNAGSPGIDGMMVEDLPNHLRVHWPRLRENLLAGGYQPQRSRGASASRTACAARSSPGSPERCVRT